MYINTIYNNIYRKMQKTRHCLKNDVKENNESFKFYFFKYQIKMN